MSDEFSFDDEYNPPLSEREPVWVGYAPAITALIIRLAMALFGVDLSGDEEQIANAATAVLVLLGGKFARNRAWSPASVHREVSQRVAAGQLAVADEVAAKRDELLNEGAQFIIDQHDAELDEAQAGWELDEEFS